VTGMIGRRDELVALRRRLTGPDRLVTLVGPGGCGKSTVARAVAADLARSFGGDVWLVPLNDLSDPHLFGHTVAPALGIQLRTGEWDVSQVIEVLAPRTGLLVLDGADPVLDATSAFASALLAGCPHISMLVTSRQPLGVTGEMVVDLEPLPYPPAGETGLAAVGDFDAVRLFVERASTVLPSFELTADNAEAVGRLTSMLEGLPLAIELAAARIQVLSPAEIVERLDDRYRLLSKGLRGTDQSHLSLRANVDASYDICTTQERELWARLSVFNGSFELGAAERVCSGDGIEEIDVLDLVDGLLDKSVLSRVEADASHVRYRLLESLRQYGEERLGDEADRWRARHLAWCAGLVQALVDDWFGPRQADWCDRARRELPTLTVAVEYGLSDPARAARFDAALSIVTGLEPFWVVSGRVSEARHWLDAALADGPGSTASSARLAAVAVGLWLAGVQRDEVATVRLAEAADQLEAQLGDAADELVRAKTLVARSSMLLWQQDPMAAAALAEESASIAAAFGDATSETTALLQLALSQALAGDTAAATETHQRCLARTEPVGELYARSFSLGIQALVELSTGALPEADRLAREALRLKAGLGDQFSTSLVLEVLAFVAAGLADPERAAVLSGAAESGWRVQGVSVDVVPLIAEQRSAGLQALRAALGERTFDQAFGRGSALTLEEAVEYAVTGSLPEPPAVVDEPTVLTKREQEVADLVGRGLTNREIAESLVISDRTAEGHVENILRKLGFTSRTQVATWVVERAVRR
jgi:predicted ATPase/DNA-binding NarL/FixJ family response regulator